MAQGTNGSFLHANLDVCVSFQRCLSGIWELSSSGSLGKNFFSMAHHPRTLFHKEFGYFKACHQDCPRPIVKFGRCQLKATAVVWARSQAVTASAAHMAGLRAPHLQRCWQEWAAGPWKVHSSPAVPGQGGGLPLTASLLETLWLQLPSLQLHQMPFFPGELEQQHQTRLISPSGILVPVYFIYLPFW